MYTFLVLTGQDGSSSKGSVLCKKQSSNCVRENEHYAEKALDDIITYLKSL